MVVFVGSAGLTIRTTFWSSYGKKNCSFFVFVIEMCLPTEHLRVHEYSLKRVRAIQIELEFRSVGF